MVLLDATAGFPNRLERLTYPGPTGCLPDRIVATRLLAGPLGSINPAAQVAITERADGGSVWTYAAMQRETAGNELPCRVPWRDVLYAIPDSFTAAITTPVFLVLTLESDPGYSARVYGD